MKPLKIVAPVPLASVAVVGGIVTGVANLLTPDPKEVMVHAAATGAVTLDFTLAGPALLDTFFFGFNGYGPECYVQSLSVDGVAVYVGFAGDGSLSVSAPGSNPAYRHGVVQLAVPVVGSIVRVQLGPSSVAPATLGVFACGRGWSPGFGFEQGSGRAIVDTGAVERLMGGGFGVSNGARAGGFQWTFGDLTPGERESLYRLVRDLGSAAPVLVIEDPDFDRGTLLNSANVTVGGRTATKTSGGAAYNGSAWTPARIGGLAVSARLTGPGVVLGFSAPPPVGPSFDSMLWSVNVDTSLLFMKGNVSIGPWAVGDRLTLTYDDGLFQILRNGVPLVARAAAPELALGLDVSLANTASVAELTLTDLNADARVHWGLLDKLDAFERADPSRTRWALRVSDWA